MQDLPGKLVIVISDSQDKGELMMHTGIEIDVKKRSVEINLTKEQKEKLMMSNKENIESVNFKSE